MKTVTCKTPRRGIKDLSLPRAPFILADFGHR
jgi:hypothetical protein